MVGLGFGQPSLVPCPGSGFTVVAAIDPKARLGVGFRLEGSFCQLLNSGTPNPNQLHREPRTAAGKFYLSSQVSQLLERLAAGEASHNL